MVKRSKTPPFHGGNRGSIPLWVTTSRRAFWLAVFLYKNTASLYRLPLLFRKRSRSAHLLACKRARDDSLSLTTFRDFCAYGAYISFWQVDPPRSKVRFAPTYFLSKISHPPTSLLLLFRKKARSRRLFACKRTHNAFRSLSPFCELRLRRICIFLAAQSTSEQSSLCRDSNVAIRASKTFGPSTSAQASYRLRRFFVQ